MNVHIIILFYFYFLFLDGFFMDVQAGRRRASGRRTASFEVYL